MFSWLCPQIEKGEGNKQSYAEPKKQEPERHDSPEERVGSAELMACFDEIMSVAFLTAAAVIRFVCFCVCAWRVPAACTRTRPPRIVGTRHVSVSSAGGASGSTCTFADVLTTSLHWFTLTSPLPVEPQRGRQEWQGRYTTG